MKSKTKPCSVCGAEIAKTAKSCPSCGAKNKKPIYKRWWFWAILIVFLAGIGSAGSTDSPAASGSAGSTSTPTPVPTPDLPVSYTHYNVTDLFDALSANALKAEKTFQDQYVELEGYLSVIDSDGKYIGIGAKSTDYEYLLQSVTCYVKNSTQLEQILDMSIGDPIVVRGQVTEIGEVLGYSLNIDSIN